MVTEPTEVYEELVDLELDLPHDVIVYMALEAHKRDMKLNDFMVLLLKQSLEEYRLD